MLTDETLWQAALKQDATGTFVFLFCTRAHNRHLFLFLFFLIKISLGLLVSALALCAYLYWNIAFLSLFPDSVVLLMGH